MEREVIQEKSKVGLKGIWSVYFADGKWSVFKKGLLFPLVISASLAGIIFFSEYDLFSYIGKINEIILAVLPNLLGFNLGAYTLFIAFGGSDFLKSIVGISEKPKEFSFYQKNSSIFSIAILLQIATLFLALIIKFVHELALPAYNQDAQCAINGSVIFILVFFGIMSVYILKDIVINIWNLSQMYHFNLWKDKQKPKDS